MAVDQLGGRSGIEDPSGAHGHHPVAQPFCLLELVGDQQHRGALGAQMVDGCPHTAAR
ncbi:MAG: hypothetical protein ACYDEN_00110 [Acidimicrobiales bacterium]